MRNKKLFVELQLLQSIKIQNVFPFNLRCKTLKNLLTHQIYNSLSSIIIQNKKELKAENIFDVRSHEKKF